MTCKNALAVFDEIPPRRREPLSQLSMGLFVKAAAAFAVALAIAKGLLLVGESGSRELALGVAMILVASVVLWMTIDHWPKWLFGFCCANVLRCAGMGLIGRTFCCEGGLISTGRTLARCQPYFMNRRNDNFRMLGWHFVAAVNNDLLATGREPSQLRL